MPDRALEQRQTRVIDFASLVTSASDSEFSNSSRSTSTWTSFARFMSVTVWLSTMDSIFDDGAELLRLSSPQTHKFEFLPWDLDHRSGSFPWVEARRSARS